ncbi:MAG: hypothetical protein EA389_09755, partial [Ilumatobacter sp.]
MAGTSYGYASVDDVHDEEEFAMYGTPRRLAAALAGAALFSASVGTAQAAEPRSVDREGARFVAQTDEADNGTENENEEGTPSLAIGDRDQLVEWWQDRL